ncbi:MAG: hypothetical protein IJO55_04515 [Lachnospiraceae bacterium]|nr:hypothetical protein [Lachnospiraceae bacterium]
MSGITYSPDKPKDCHFCYYWKNNKVGCKLGVEKCYYRVTPKKAVSECDGCPYGRASPCIGWCTKRILEEMGTNHFGKRGGDNA